MWRWIAAVFVVAAALGIAVLLRDLIHDQDGAAGIASILGTFGIALLWPVEFGLKERPPR